ncbi:hypothetical protein AAFF_G00280920 [Aldrovandia affinis]|uniref:Galactose-3-O-sulfotransferase 2 n=1 Tax=Aldrovandia affinis TaxID=143900 RepID=A0AAD7RAL6_9TELE|nr:hypothetical protein AAFF_G00280920 [Aldrovandia affinis]
MGSPGACFRCWNAITERKRSHLFMIKLALGLISLIFIFGMKNSIPVLKMVQSKYEVLLEKRIPPSGQPKQHTDRNSDVTLTARCSPKRHLMFLKTHKTGGTTVQNMLLRYVDSRNLTLATPPRGRVTFNEKFPFSANYVRDYNKQQYDVIAHHLRFKITQVKKVLKHNDTFYFSILRDPVNLMESSYSFFKKDFPAFRLSKSLEDLLNNSSSYYNPYLNTNTRVKNPTWFDFGYNNIANCSEEQYTKALVEIEKSFHLILISEYFDESMILLKEALCWDIDDVVTFKHNSRNKEDIKTVSENLARKIQEWNSLDWRLYNHFNVTFWAKVEETIGLARLQDEVAILREKRRELERQCTLDGLVVNQGRYFKEGLHLMSHKVKSDLDRDLKEKCKRYFIHPRDYTEILYTKQKLQK